MKNILKIIGLFSFIYMNKLLSQQNDFATWNYVNVNLKLNENLSILWSEQMLRNENATESWIYFHDLSLNQWISSNFSQEFHIRLINQKQINNTFQDRELVYYALNCKKKLGDFQLQFRSRWQGMAYAMHFNDDFKGPYFYHRFRMSLSKSVNYHWKTSGNVEFFQPLNRPKHAAIDQIRYGIMLTNVVNRNISIDHFFQIQHQIGRINPYTYFVYGLGCNFVF